MIRVVHLMETVKILDFRGEDPQKKRGEDYPWLTRHILRLVNKVLREGQQGPSRKGKEETVVDGDRGTVNTEGEEVKWGSKVTCRRRRQTNKTRNKNNFVRSVPTVCSSQNYNLTEVWDSYPSRVVWPGVSLYLITLYHQINPFEVYCSLDSHNR